MSRDDFDALVRRLEGVAQRNPSRFNSRILGLVVLAYAYLSLVLLGSLLLTAATVYLMVIVHNAAAIKLGLAGLVLFGGLSWVVLRGLWVKLDPPAGQRVTPAQAPKLFAMLDELRAALQCKPFHEVLIDNDHNAAVVQVPRLGVFGWHRNYLLLGFPLMQSLAPAEFQAVLAHEFAHSSGGHGRFGNWLYRIRRSWDRIFEQMSKQQTRGAFVLTKFLNWFWPRFNAHAFVLSRANEYEADACAVRLAGADAAASALTRLPVGGALLSEKFWPDVFARANQEKEPPADVAVAATRLLKAGPGGADAARWLRHAFLAETNNDDTHPCLKDRLRAIGRLPAGVERGEFPSVPPPVSSPTAAEFFLEAHAEVVARALSDEWCKSIKPLWEMRHEQTQKLAHDLAALEQPSDAPLSPDALWQKAGKLIELHDDKAALPVIEELLAREPKHAGANFVRGRYHLEQDDPRGVGFIEAALAADPALTPEGCNLLYGHYTRTGQREKLRPLEEQMDRFQEVAQLAQAERANVSTRDTFVPAEQTAEQTAALQKIFAAEPEISAVAVARKQVTHLAGSACHVLAVRIKVPWWKPRSSDASQRLLNRLLEKIDLPGQFLVFVDEQNLKGVARKIFALPGAEIYRRAAKP